MHLPQNAKKPGGHISERCCSARRLCGEHAVRHTGTGSWVRAVYTIDKAWGAPYMGMCGGIPGPGPPQKRSRTTKLGPGPPNEVQDHQMRSRNPVLVVQEPCISGPGTCISGPGTLYLVHFGPGTLYLVHFGPGTLYFGPGTLYFWSRNPGNPVFWSRNPGNPVLVSRNPVLVVQEPCTGGPVVQEPCIWWSSGPGTLYLVVQEPCIWWSRNPVFVVQKPWFCGPETLF